MLSHLNVEIKARTKEQETIREILKSNNADFIGVDHQVDTYFKVNSGRLKLREGNIENHLIYYERESTKGPKKSNVFLYKNKPGSNLKEMLIKSLGVLTIVEKRREIYFIDNVKFHLDNVVGLGMFVEIEAIDKEETIGYDKLLGQCNYYLNILRISKDDLIKTSYSDLLLS